MCPRAHFAAHFTLRNTLVATRQISQALQVHDTRRPGPALWVGGLQPGKAHLGRGRDVILFVVFF